MTRKLIRAGIAARKGLNSAPAVAALPKPFRLKKAAPPEQTNAEGFYYQKQMANKTRMIIVLRDGEKIAGVIEWYDRHALKVNRVGGPNILLLKDAVKYMYKERDEAGGEDD
jgi:host factor-I protein